MQIKCYTVKNFHWWRLRHMANNNSYNGAIYWLNELGGMAGVW